MTFDLTNGESCFITGTDTGVGKTHVSARLLRAWRKNGRDAVAMKPICCGDRGDAEELHVACDGAVPVDDINPIWLRPPTAPYTASIIEERPIDLDRIHRDFARLREEFPVVLVEGVGGWLVPIRRDYLVSDLAAEFGLPVIVVAANQLGMLNHTMLTVQSIRARGLTCAGIILNHPAATEEGDPAVITNRSILEDTLDVPILAEYAWEARG
ncbi:MAG: dethiobiotin synthase [Chthoniobacteraceae bacterium]